MSGSKRRPENAIRLVAIDFKIDERTLRRWICDRPELRPVLRAVRHGKQWRLNPPSTQKEFLIYKRDVLRAVRPFRRRRKKGEGWEKSVALALGYGSARRELNLQILREAMKLRLMKKERVTSTDKGQSKYREAKISQCVGAARIIAGKRGCEVFDVPQFLNDGDQSRDGKNLARRIRQLWPTKQEWDEVSDRVTKLWRNRSLAKAAYQLAQDNKQITGENLAGLLFLNDHREHAWTTNLKQIEYQRKTGLEGVLDLYAKRGISLRLFRQRYRLKDIQEAKAAAEGITRADASENLAGSICEGYVYEDGGVKGGAAARPRWVRKNKNYYPGWRRGPRGLLHAAMSTTLTAVSGLISAYLFASEGFTNSR